MRHFHALKDFLKPPSLKSGLISRVYLSPNAVFSKNISSYSTWKHKYKQYNEPNESESEERFQWLRSKTLSLTIKKSINFIFTRTWISNYKGCHVANGIGIYSIHLMFLKLFCFSATTGTSLFMVLHFPAFHR